MIKIILIILGIILGIILVINLLLDLFEFLIPTISIWLTMKNCVNDFRDGLKREKELRHKRALKRIENEILKMVIKEIRNRRSL